MKYCIKCVQPDTRPNTVFKNGLCPACDFNTKKNKNEVKKIEYDLTIESFKEYIKPHLVDSNGYDCCLGVSGGKDSTKQALFARDILGLKPMLISLVFPPELMTNIGAKNISNLSKLGFQIELLSPGPADWRRLMLLALNKFGNPLVPTEQALYSSVPRVAIGLGLKLILWGENPALQLGDMNTLGNHPFDGDNLRKTNTLRNNDTKWMEELSPDISSLKPYIYPDYKLYDIAGLKTVFMGPVMNDWSLVNNSIFACLNGLEIRNEPPEEIGDTYGVQALDQNITLINQVIKYLKFGFGRMTDYANEEIRLSRMTRAYAIDLINKYDGKCSKKYFEYFADYLGISYKDLWNIINKFVNKNLFERKGIDEYKPKFVVGEGL